jgi:hypothetical protein
VFGPNRADLLVGCEFSARGGGFRARQGGTLVVAERHRRIVGAGQFQYGARDLVLIARRQPAGDFDA